MICNGIPKSGTHALARACQLLGLTTKHQHTPHAEKSGDRQILIARNPRDMMVSWLRFNRAQVTQGFLIHLFRDFDGHPLRESFARYEPYLTDGTLVVRFEELFTDDGATLQRIADYAGVQVLDDAYDNIVGLTKTYTGEHSNWRDHWSDAVEDAWVIAGGLEVEKAWSY